MKIKEAIEKNIRRVYDPKWLEINCYIKLPKKTGGKCSPLCYLYSEDMQSYMGIDTPQSFFIDAMINGDQSECEEYKGKLSQFDKED